MQTKWKDLLLTLPLFRKQSTNISLRGRIYNRFKNYSSNQFENHATSNFYQNVRKPKILKPLVFTISVSVTSFSGCAILQYERRKAETRTNNSFWDRMKIQRNEKAFAFRNKINTWWNNLHEGHKIAAGLIGVNCLTFAIWQLPPCRPFMTRWFTSSPANKRSSTLLLSCFSHSEFWHLGANMFVLWSFAPLIQSILGTEQLIAFYLTSGCVSSYVSHCYKIASKSKIPSLGASGALLAVLAACCIETPEARLSIIFLPFLTFSAKTALFSIITLDVCGLLFRWRLFDHACHLGGTLFGSWYILYGHKYTWDKRAPITRKWHEMNNPNSKI